MYLPWNVDGRLTTLELNIFCFKQKQCSLLIRALRSIEHFTVWRLELGFEPPLTGCDAYVPILQRLQTLQVRMFKFAQLPLHVGFQINHAACELGHVYWLASSMGPNLKALHIGYAEKISKCHAHTLLALQVIVDGCPLLEYFAMPSTNHRGIAAVEWPEWRQTLKVYGYKNDISLFKGGVTHLERPGNNWKVYYDYWPKAATNYITSKCRRMEHEWDKKNQDTCYSSF